MPIRLAAHQPQVRFVDQGGRLERLAGRLVGQPLGRQAAQLLVNEREQPAGGVRVALLDGFQNARDLAHAVENNRRAEGRQMDHDYSPAVA